MHDPEALTVEVEFPTGRRRVPAFVRCARPGSGDISTIEPEAMDGYDFIPLLSGGWLAIRRARDV